MARPLNILIGVSLSALALTGCDGFGAAATDAGEVDAARGDGVEVGAEAAIETSVLLENAQVRVTRVKVPVEGSMQPHDGQRRVVYALTDSEINWRPHGAVAERLLWPEASVHFHDAGRHGLANVGSTPARFLIFERLAAPPLAVVLKTATDADMTAPDGGEVLAENTSFRVLRVTLKPGQVQLPHAGQPLVVHMLSDANVIVEAGGAAAQQRQWQAGKAYWLAAGLDGVRNTGKADASWLIVELKD